MDVRVDAIEPAKSSDGLVGHLLPSVACLVELSEVAEEALELESELRVAADVLALGHIEPRFIARDEIEVAEEVGGADEGGGGNRNIGQELDLGNVRQGGLDVDVDELGGELRTRAAEGKAPPGCENDFLELVDPLDELDAKGDEYAASGLGLALIHM